MAWVPWAKIDSEWWRFEPQTQWLAALDVAVNGVILHGLDRYSSRVVVVILWDGWGQPTDSCNWGGPHCDPADVDAEVAAENYEAGAPDPWAGKRIE